MTPEVRDAAWDGNPNMHAIARAVRYNRYIVEAVRPFLGERVLDVGCGIGNTTMLLERPFVVGLEPAEVYYRGFRARLPAIEAVHGDITDPGIVERLRAYRFDTVFSSNVLEHIPDDVGALTHIRRILVPGGRLVLVVPQYQWLYGEQDRDVEHCRRYSRRVLQERLGQAGFTPAETFSLNFPGIFWWYLNGRILRKPAMEEWEPGFINRVVPLVRLADRLTFRRAGLSLVQVARA